MKKKKRGVRVATQKDLRRLWKELEKKNSGRYIGVDLKY